MRGMVQLAPPKPDDLAVLREIAETQKHGVFLPTDVMWKDGKRVGYFSIGQLPLVLAWLSTTDMKARESFHTINSMESIVRRGAPGLYIPVGKDSPFYPIMPELGYANGGNYDLFYKLF